MPLSTIAPRLPSLVTGVLILLGGMAGAGAAQQCPEPRTAASPAAPTDPNAPVNVYADTMILDQAGRAIFTGNVELIQHDRRISAERVEYDKAGDELSASGAVTLETRGGDRFETGGLVLRPRADTGNTGAASYQLAGQAHGEAASIEFLSEQHLRMRKVSYTTCPPGQEAWLLKVGELELDQGEDIGRARHATVHVGKVPVLYWPYIDFPLSGQRKTGFLAPEFGGGENSGSYVGVPYYFNIAPSVDDTLTPRVYARRGVHVSNELRYLGRRYSGILDLAYLPNDRVYEDDRAAAVFRHQQGLGERWTADMDINWVSDNDYLEDFGDSLDSTSETHLPQRVDLAYRGELMTFGARSLAYQTVDKTIDEGQEPYDILPQLHLTLQSPRHSNRVNGALRSEWSRFHRDEGLVGQRLVLDPGIDLPLRASYGHFVPAAGAHYMGYNLAATDARFRDLLFEERRGETVPYFSLDTGIYLDREFDWGDGAYTQSLEPRLFYAYAPYVFQDRLPVFDTSVPDFSFYNLFRVNRFVGGDRFGDANQLSVALSSRISDRDTGKERLRAAIGQIHYFRDRLVSLDDAAPETRATSDLVGELSSYLGDHWYLRTTVQWDPRAEQTASEGVFIQYQPSADRIVNLGYRRLRDEEQQSDISFQWPLAARWTVLGRWNYSWEQEENLESYGGIEYRSCCWAVRSAINQRLTGSGEQSYSYMLQFELTGLANVGDAPRSPLDQSMFDMQ